MWREGDAFEFFTSFMISWTKIADPHSTLFEKLVASYRAPTKKVFASS
jgi:hypothetical protein